MTANVLTPQRSPISGSQGDRRPRFAAPWNIAMSVSVNAERHRLFQALTLPEYMEAWMRIPGFRDNEQIAVTCTSESYRILASDSHGMQVSIAGVYRVSRRGKMIFTWKKGPAPNAGLSLVTIRLIGDFARTTLLLSHGGLLSKTEYNWHRAFWEGSLGRLQSLFQSH